MPLELLMTLCGSCHSQYEADRRVGEATDHRQLVDGIARLLRSARGGVAAGDAAHE